MTLKAHRGRCAHCGHDHDAARKMAEYRALASQATAELPTMPEPAKEGYVPLHELYQRLAADQVQAYGLACYEAGRASRAQSEGEPRDWEISCDECAGTGKVDVSEALHVDGRYMGDQLLRETCNACTGYGFTVCVADIPKEIQQ